MLLPGPVDLKQVITLIDDTMVPGSACKPGETEMQITGTDIGTCVVPQVLSRVADMDDSPWFQFSHVENPTGLALSVDVPGPRTLYLMISSTEYTEHQITQRAGGIGKMKPN